MAEKKDAMQKADPCDRTEKSREKSSGEPEKELQRDPGEQGRPKKRVKPRRGGEEAAANKEASLTKRRQVRKVAKMVKRLKKSTEDPEQQHKAEVEAGQIAGGGWDAQQQVTVAAYARARGMEPQEVLQALVSSMEKTLRKERSESLTGQVPSPKSSQWNKPGGKPEVKPNPESGKRGSRDKDIEARCITCNKGKRKGIPPKARWKEEQKERARGPRELQNEELEDGTRDSGANAESKGKENRIEVAPIDLQDLTSSKICYSRPTAMISNI